MKLQEPTEEQKSRIRIESQLLTILLYYTLKR